MPIYEVRSLDVWGNGVEGYEINDSFHAGNVSFRSNATDEQKLTALKVDFIADAATLNQISFDSSDPDSIEVHQQVNEAAIVAKSRPPVWFCV